MQVLGTQTLIGSVAAKLASDGLILASLPVFVISALPVHLPLGTDMPLAGVPSRLTQLTNPSEVTLIDRTADAAVFAGGHAGTYGYGVLT